MINVLDLFSGIGGFSLGLERTGGFRTVAFCEVKKAAQQRLNKRWPGVPCYVDVCALTAERLRADGVRVDLICGGFPCQDISLAGPGEGLAGQRSRLWWEYARLIEEIQPEWCIVENVSALRSRGLDVVLGCFAALGYDAEWHCVPASAVGAPHRRDRVWIIAHAQGRGSRCNGAGHIEVVTPGAAFLGDPNGSGRFSGTQRGPHSRAEGAGPRGEQSERSGCDERTGQVVLADAKSAQRRAGVCQTGQVSHWYELGNGGASLPDTDDGKGRRFQPIGGQVGRNTDVAGDGAQGLVAVGADTDCTGLEVRQTRYPSGAWAQCWTSLERSGWWSVEPDVGRVADGIPARVDRLECLGNAVVPEIPEQAGLAILLRIAEAHHAA